MPEKVQPGRLRGFWHGNIVFGLVSVPVSLFVANRPGRISLRMVDRAGVVLSRRYFCEREQRALGDEEIVRGYEIDDNTYVVVEDEELEAIAPEKSREINLEQFVDLAELDPVYFERAYFLAPGKGGGTPYRLLAQAMADAGRAGIATFVMRGKQYLVAVLAEQGILRAETLRFHDELRAPEDVGLPEPIKPGKARAREIERAMVALRSEKLDKDLLADTYAQRLEDLVQQKLDEDDDVFRAPEDAEPSERASADVIDLMQVLKKRLRGRAAAAGKRSGHTSGSTGRGNLEGRTRSELYERAKELDIAGRSKMSRKQLVDAIRGH